MERYSHFGMPVAYIVNDGVRYEDVLSKNNIPYEVLPVFIKGIRLLRYNDKFALIKVMEIPEYEFEYVYVFEDMPEDYNILNLIEDVDNQRRGEQPQRKKSVFMKLYSMIASEAEKYYRDRTFDSNDILSMGLSNEIDGKYDDQFWIDIIFGFQDYGYQMSRIKDLPMDEDDKPFFEELMREAEKAYGNKMTAYVNKLNEDS